MPDNGVSKWQYTNRCLCAWEISNRIWSLFLWRVKIALCFVVRARCRERPYAIDVVWVKYSAQFDACLTYLHTCVHTYTYVLSHFTFFVVLPLIWYGFYVVILKWNVCSWLIDTRDLIQKISLYRLSNWIN